MFMVINTFIHIIKTFLCGLLSSVVFAALIKMELVAENGFFALVMLVLSFFLFLLLYYRMLSKLFIESFNIYEYLVPVIISYLIYFTVSYFLYTNETEGIYNWVFFFTRYLEPVVEKKMISFYSSHIIVAGMIFYFPFISRY